MSDWGSGERFHWWPGPMTIDFASQFFCLDPGLLERVEPRFKALPRATVPDDVMREVVSIRTRMALMYKSGPESGTWPGHGGLKEGERLVMLDTETVFALAVYLGLDPKEQLKSSWPLSTQLMHCWRWYVERDPQGFLAKGREAAVKAGVDLLTIVPTDPGDLREWKREATKANGKRIQWIGPPTFRPWWRFMSVVRAPWFDEERMEVQWGFLCKTCAKPRMWSTALAAEEKFWEFTVEQFERHLEERGGVVDGHHGI